MIILEIIFYFLAWTLLIYWMHRLAHQYQIPLLSRFHREHHKFVANNKITWKFNNIFLFNDNWSSTVDFWLTEVIPTAIFVLITEQYWLGIIFYFYAAFIQEWVEHNENFSGYPLYTSGKWHLLHHTKYPCNFGILTPLWDFVFGTARKIST
jgi:sterol desaturase/sphingolipid hydroxylase (fatty acid hydroxylase superfamily)